MEQRQNCILALASIPDGKHIVSFQLDESFFTANPVPDIQTPSVTAQVFLERLGSQIKGLIELEGTGMMDCDICLDLCRVSFENDADFVIEIGGSSDARGTLDNIYNVAADAEECDITDLVVDTVILGLPVKRDHGVDASGNYLCTGEVAKLVGKYIVKNEESADPRWDGLTNIKFN